ncbi:MAG: hypothetical protein HY722_13250 [Planctomycetes bacterium]|nr:hypothetical protein [Planctomycetota bacterium]
MSNVISQVAFVVGISVLFYFLLRWRHRVQQRAFGFDARQYTAEREETALKESMDGLLVEIQETAREMNGRMDSKMRLLNQLIADADDRLTRMAQVRDELERAAAAALARTVEGAAAAAPGLAPAPGGARRPTLATASPPERHAEVHALADRGLGSPEIASRLGRHLGEVELILGLRKTRLDTPVTLASSPPVPTEGDPARACVGPGEVAALLRSTSSPGLDVPASGTPDRS